MKRAFVIAMSVVIAAEANAQVTPSAFRNPLTDILDRPGILQMQTGYASIATSPATEMRGLVGWTMMAGDHSGFQLGLNFGSVRSSERSLSYSGVHLRFSTLVHNLHTSLRIGGGVIGRDRQPSVRADFSAGTANAQLRIMSTWLPDSPQRDSLIGAPTQRYTDTEVTLRRGFGRLAFEATGGSRFGVIENGPARWLNADVSIPVYKKLRLALSGGDRPERLEYGQSGGRFIQLAVRIDGLTGDSPQPARGDSRNTRIETIAISKNRYVIRITTPAAESVELKGDLTNWKPVVMERTDERRTWEVELNAVPGVYRILLKIDGGRWHVPDGLAAVTDDFGLLAGLLTLM